MKLILTMCLLLSVQILFAQDRIVKLTGDTISCSIKEISADHVKYSYKGESIINSLSLNVVQEIVFESGRTQQINSRVRVTSVEDWEKVKITTLESDIEGLVRGEEMMAKASSGWSTTNQGKMEQKAMEKLKKDAAAKGYHVVLLITTTGKGGHGGISGGTKASVTGVGYKYE